MATRYSLSETFSIDSQPGMQAFNTSGSFSPRQTSACGNGMSCSPVISMGVPLCGPRQRRAGLLYRAPSGKIAGMHSRVEAAAFALMTLLCGLAPAQVWPAKPVRIVVPFAPGGTADTLGRQVAQKLTETLQENFIIENRPGAGGVIGSELVAKAAPDGYTLLVSGVATHCIAPALSKNFPFDPVRDFTHIALFGGPPGVLVINPSLSARNLKEFIALAKAEPGKLAYGSPGNGTQGHLIAEQLKQVAGIEMTHVPYKGASLAVADLIAGHVPGTSPTCRRSASSAIRNSRPRSGSPFPGRQGLRPRSSAA